MEGETVQEVTIDIKVIRADGTIEDHGRVGYWHRSRLRRFWYRHRPRFGDRGAIVVVNGGQAIVTNRITGAGTEPGFLGWGTGAGTAGVTDTTLFSEKALDLSATTGTRVTGTTSRQTTTVTNDTWRVTGTMTATGAGTVTNVGCWDNSAIGSGTLYVKADSASFTGAASVALQSGDSLVPTINVKFA